MEGNAYMSFAIDQIGSLIASDAREPAPVVKVPTTVSELLVLLSKEPPESFPMLRSTASKIAQFCGTSTEELTLDRVYQMRLQFRRYLEKAPYTENSIRTYVNYSNVLIQLARRQGWRPGQELPKEWQQVLALAPKRKCTDIVLYLALIRRTPNDVTVEDVDEWAEGRVQQGRSYRTTRGKKGRFWRILRDCGHSANIPAVVLRDRIYGIAFDQFPQQLRREVDALLKWKTADFCPDRPKGGKIRQVTAEMIREKVCHLLGFAVRIRGLTEINSLPQLVRKEIISDYLAWCINERKVKGRTLQIHLGHLEFAMRQHSAYTSLDLKWFKEILDRLPIEPESEQRMRKVKKYLDYPLVEAIPAQLRAERLSAAKDGQERVAILAMEELLLTWLITLAWRQRNIRECRIGGSRPNLFKAKIPNYIWVDKPAWVQAEERSNPESTFWQVHFAPEEIKTGTKTGKSIHAVLPRPLIRPLEEYLSVFRPRLVTVRDPGTLFVKGDGTSLNDENVTDLISRLTLKYAGKRVNPHLMRDIVAFAWLKEHPKDYLTLSKILWHSNINYTIKVYGSQFDESSGVCAMEAWIEEREARPK
jgi:integrase